jgi:hypothetical protein
VTARRVGAAVAVLVLAGCTSVVGGRGQPSGTPSSTGARSTASASPSASVVSTPAAPPADILRTPVQTAIGDPVTADLCTAIGLDALRNLRAGVTPSFDDRQYPPGCSVTFNDGATHVVGLSVFASQGRPAAADHRTSRVASGQTVYSYPFDAATGSCRRAIKAEGVLLTVDSAQVGTAVPGKSIACAGTDAMTTRLVAVAAGHYLPRLQLADPSLSVLAACKVVTKAGIRTLPAFAGGAIRTQGFGASCQLRTAKLFLFIDFAIADAARPPGSTATTVEGHRMYSRGSRADFCSYVSTQGTTSDGRYEQVVASATVPVTASAPAELCEQTTLALARYLAAAGLR